MKNKKKKPDPPARQALEMDLALALALQNRDRIWCHRVQFVPVMVCWTHFHDQYPPLHLTHIPTHKA
jgi:hypothetical protein